MSIFHKRLAQAIDASSKYAGNRAKLSRELGMSGNYVSTILSTESNPNFDIAVKMAHELEVSLAYLAGSTAQPFDLSELSSDGPITDRAMQFFDQIAGSLRQAAVLRGEEPTIDDLMTRWYRYDKRLTGFDVIQEWFDLYEAPARDDVRLKVRRMGGSSLAARTLGKADLKSLQYALDEVPDHALRAHLMESYRRAAEGHPVLTEEYLDILAPGHAEKIRLDYLRLLLPVRDPADAALIISYSKPLR